MFIDIDYSLSLKVFFLFTFFTSVPVVYIFVNLPPLGRGGGGGGGMNKGAWWEKKANVCAQNGHNCFIYRNLKRMEYRTQMMGRRDRACSALSVFERPRNQ